MENINKIHTNNKKALEKNGFVITNYINNRYKLVLEAKHKDGRKVSISV